MATGRTEARRGWQQWSEGEARGALRAHARSGLSAEDFAEREGYSTQRLRYWQKRLSVVDAVSFVPVELPVAAKATPTSMPTRTPIEISCDGVVIRVREDLDAEHLARIVVALATERARRC